MAATECEDLMSTSCSAIFVHLAVREPDLVAMINGVEDVNEEEKKDVQIKGFGRR
jgi:hypothetical protein